MDLNYLVKVALLMSSLSKTGENIAPALDPAPKATTPSKSYNLTPVKPQKSYKLTPVQSNSTQAAVPKENTVSQTIPKENNWDALKSFHYRTENSINKGYNAKKDLYFPYNSVEGGAKTIGPGIKDPPQSTYSGVTKEQLDALYEKALSKARTGASNYFEGRFGQGAWNNLTNGVPEGLPSNWKQMIATDYQYNLGNAGKFPKFMEALYNNDSQGMLKEYMRYYTPDGTTNKVPLGERNTLTYDQWLAPLLKK